jgi:asparagine synthase (glutamine-hydrolysing)
MCGINAVYKYTGINKEDFKRVKSMNDKMRYRGPDGEGYWNDEHCALGHVRLSIIGLESGAQPLYNRDKSLVLVSNGEIYNYRELKKEVAAKGYECTTDSDCEVILYLYELYGLEFVHHLRGMFAFCLYDTKKQQLIVVRDRIGEERVYYAEVPCGVVISSELKTILQEYIPQPQLDVEALLAPIRFTGGIDKRNTWVEQIKRVLPGEMLIIDANGVQRKRYWERKRTYDYAGTLEQSKEKTLELMQEAVNLNMRSDVPVAVMLSGGVDSSVVAALLIKAIGSQLHCVHVNHGLMRQGESENVIEVFEKGLNASLVYVDATERFLNKLANVSCSVVGLGDLVHNSILHTYIESIVCIEIQRIQHKFTSESSCDHGVTLAHPDARSIAFHALSSRSPKL